MVRNKVVSVAGGRFNLVKKLYLGKVEIYTGQDNKFREAVTIKLEKVDAENPQIIKEYQYNKIFENGPGIANVRYFGREKDYNMLVIDLLDHTLEQWFKLCGRKFTLKTVGMIGVQLFDIAKHIHSKKYIHRDMKPENFMTSSVGGDRDIFLTKHHLAIPYVTREGKHVEEGKAQVLVGTARYASINLHLGNITSRRDDMETLGYILVYFSKGELPWQGIQGSTLREKFEKITEVKQNTTIETLCEGLPQELFGYMRYVRGLEFTAEPDYAYCTTLFEGMMTANNIDNDGEYDWIILMSKKTV